MTATSLSSRSAPASSRTFLAWLWLVLAAIGAHAMLPVGSPEVRASGSAFSASTVDVALQPRRRAPAAQQRLVQPRPDAPAGMVTTAVAAWRPLSTAPPTQATVFGAAVDLTDGARIAARTFPARAPPQA